MNQVAHLCELMGADVDEVREIISADERIGPHFLYAGVGYGGSCFPKDVRGLAAIARKHGSAASFIEEIEAVNELQKKRIAEKVLRALGDASGKRVALWGLAFKPHTDDMRHAPSIAIIEELLKNGVKVSAYDPVAAETAKKIFGDRIEYAPDMYACAEGTHALLVVTEWPEFKDANFEKVGESMREKLILDGRNIYDASEMRGLGFNYLGVGRK
jgi:UDPglucose 6-dehydrogenase